MDKVNGRRSFLKGFGIGGVVLGGAASGYLAATREIANVASASIPSAVSNGDALQASAGAPDIAHLAPKEGATSLVITGDNRPPAPPPPVVYNPDNGYTLACSTSSMSTLMISGNHVNKCPPDELNRVSMAVGKDDRLWIKVGEQWKRVVLEG
jgi:hypothetical protein